MIIILGSTVPVRNGINNCFIYGDLWECECIQIYSTSSRKWDIKDKPDNDMVVKFKSAYKKSNVRMVVSHIPFLVNLCAEDMELQKKSVARLRTELVYNNKFGIQYTVLHPGSHKDKEKAIEVIAKNINMVLDEFDNLNQCVILLETMSGQGNYLGSLEEIAQIINLIKNKNCIGVCLDIAHIYQNGYDINNNYDDIKKIIDKIIGLEFIKALHINDSLTRLESHVDRHAFNGEGYINIETFRKIVNDSNFLSLPKILELPDIYRSQEALNILKSLKE